MIAATTRDRDVLRSVLQRRLSHRPPKGLVRLNRGNGPTLCFMHTAGGGIAPYAPLAEAMGTSFASYGLLPIEHADVATLADLAKHHAATLRRSFALADTILVGWSLAGVVAHATAAELESRGDRVRALALLDSRIPAAHDDLAAASRDPGFGMAIDAWLGEQAGSAATGASIKAARAHLLAAHALTAGYRPRPLAARILFLAAMRGGTSVADAAAWRPAGGGPVDARIDCAHDTMLAPGPVDTVAAALTRLLDQITSSPTSPQGA